MSLPPPRNVVVDEWHRNLSVESDSDTGEPYAACNHAAGSGSDSDYGEAYHPAEQPLFAVAAQPIATVASLETDGIVMGRFQVPGMEHDERVAQSIVDDRWGAGAAAHAHGAAMIDAPARNQLRESVDLGLQSDQTHTKLHPVVAAQRPAALSRDAPHQAPMPQQQQQPELQNLGTFASHMGKLNKDYMWLVQEERRMAPYRYYDLALAARPDRPIMCVLCCAAPVQDVIFPCQHMCVCQGCMHHNSIVPGEGCPLCLQVIKRIIPYQGHGREEHEYWDWCHEIRPPLPRGFARRFIQPARLQKALATRTARRLASRISAYDGGDDTHRSSESDAGVVVRGGHATGCCAVS